MDIGAFLQACFFLFGAVTGSFLNVCIVRLPQEKSIVTPGSHCVKCGKAVRWFDNIPLISYVLLHGKCRDCGAGFSARYFFIEFLTAWLFLGFYSYFGLTWLLLPYLFFVSGLVVATFVDFEYRIIPDQLSIYGIPVAFVMSFFLPGLHLKAGAPSLAAGWVVGFMLVALSYMLMLIEAFRRRSRLLKEDLHLAIGVFAILLFQCICCLYADFSTPLGFRLASLTFSMEGMVVGGGALFLMGIVGALLIQKRVVTLIDLKMITDRPEDLFKELVHQSYINDAGEIKQKFTSLKGAEGFVLSGQWVADQVKIYELLVSCLDGGVMGGGDVKLMAVVGAFLGWKLALLTIVLAPFIAAPVGIVEKIRTKSSAIAFGPYLAMASIASLLWGEKIIAWALSGYGMY